MKKTFLLLTTVLMSVMMTAQTISSSTVSLRFCFNDSATINEQVCKYSGIKINDSTYTKAGTYKQYLKTVRGCDSVLTIVLTEQADCKPEGCINALFSVSATKQVYFSQGNLQYRACENTPGDWTYTAADGTTKNGRWKFADTQWAIMGNNNSNVSSTSTVWFDLFQWGTSGYTAYPYKTSEDLAYINGITDFTGANKYYDWGQYNPISNGGNKPGVWRTLTKEEWTYLMNRSGKVFGATIENTTQGNVKGIVILPDGTWFGRTMNTGMAYTANTISYNEWTTTMAPYGAVFLPECGYRERGNHGTNPSQYRPGTNRYWHATGCDSESGKTDWAQKAWYVYNNESGSFHVDYDLYRYYGMGVRLVADK